MTNISITTVLHTTNEIVLHAQFLAALLQSRAENAQPQGPIQHAPVEQQPVVQPAPQQTYTGPQLVKDERPAPVAVPNPTDVEAKFRAYAAEKGVGAARALLSKYNAERLQNVAAEQLQAFYEELGS